MNKYTAVIYTTETVAERVFINANSKEEAEEMIWKSQWDEVEFLECADQELVSVEEIELIDE